MNRQKRLFLFFLLLFTIFSVGALFAQRKTSVTIIASEAPAQVYINGRMIGLATPRYQFQIEPGNYELKVVKPGRPEFKRRITVGSRAMNLNINLSGSAPPVQLPKKHQLSINGNVAGAEVFVDGSLSGNIPFRGDFPEGRYDLRIIAPGFREYSRRINLNDAERLYVSLDPLYARLKVDIPSTLLNNNTGNPMARIDLFINETKINGFSTQVEEGTHLVRISSGGLSVESYVSVKAGQNYTITPRFDFLVD